MYMYFYSSLQHYHLALVLVNILHMHTDGSTYLRCTQSEDHLALAALIHVNYTRSIDVNEVCKMFMQKNPRRLEAPGMLFESSVE